MNVTGRDKVVGDCDPVLGRCHIRQGDVVVVVIEDKKEGSGTAYVVVPSSASLLTHLTDSLLNVGE